MELNLKSTTATLYKWFYNIEDRELPKNLCPFFWKMAFMYIVIIPWTLLILPSVIIDLINRRIFSEGEFEGENTDKIIMSTGIYLVLLILYSLGIVPLWALDIITYTNEAILALGTIAWLLLIIAGAYYGTEFLIKKVRVKLSLNSKNSAPKPPKVNILVEFVKAKYHKYCPQITWK